MISDALLFVDDAGFRLGFLQAGKPVFQSIPSAPTLAEQVQRLKKHLNEIGQDQSPLLLAIPSSWCLCATLENIKLDRSTRKTTLAYRLEEHLPLSAEEMTCDFILHDNAQALGVSVETSKLLHLVQSLKTASILIGRVCPAALLAAQYAANINPAAHAVLVNSDFIELHDSKPIRWNWFNNDPASLAEIVNEIPIEKTIVITPSIDIPDSSQFIVLPVSQEVAALNQGLQILACACKPWIDLRCEGLVQAGQSKTRSRQFLVASLAMLLICFILATQYRARQFASLVNQFNDRQITLFKTVMPNQSIPGSIQARLSSEHQRLANLKGPDLSQSSLLNAPTALTHLKTILRSLPSDLRFQIKDLSIRPDAIFFDGLAKSHAQAEQIAQSIRETGQYDVDAPKTLSNPQGVSFIFTAKPIDNRKPHASAK